MAYLPERAVKVIILSSGEDSSGISFRRGRFEVGCPAGPVGCIVGTLAGAAIGGLAGQYIDQLYGISGSYIDYSRPVDQGVLFRGKRSSARVSNRLR